MKTFLSLLKRELRTALLTPHVYVLLLVYLVLSGLLTLTIGGFIDANDAALTGFFAWQPWLFLFMGAALAMGSWSESYRDGTAELLLTTPASHCQLVLSKFTAAWAILTAGLLMTAPLPIICGWLGSPDWGAMAAGYLATWLTAGLFLALGQAASVLSRTQFVSFLLTVVVGLCWLLAGFRPCNLLLIKWGVPATFIDNVAACSLTRHYEIMVSGLISAEALFSFVGGTILLLFFTAWRLQRRHARPCKVLPWAVIAGIIVLSAIISLTNWRWDCTEEGLYTLDAGSREILTALQSPVEITFYYSQNNPELSAPIRRHASRTEMLLEQLRQANPGKITIQNVIPETLSSQTAAEAAGLLPHIGSMGDMWFLGITIKGAAAAPAVIPDLSPSISESLEYQLIRGINAVQQKELPRIGVISTLPLFAQNNATNPQMAQPWWALRQLAKKFDLVNIAPQAAGLPSDLALIILVHPYGLDKDLVAALQKFSASGKPLMLCLDSLCRSEAQLQGRFAPQMPSLMPELLATWGVTLSRKVVADRTLASPMTDPNRGLEILPTLLNCDPIHLSRSCPITEHLSNLRLFCAGELSFNSTPEVTVTPLAWTSKDSRLLATYEAQRNAADMLTDFVPDNTSRVVAALLSKGNQRAVVISDADWLHNSLCVNIASDSRGVPQEIAVSDNAAFLANSVEFLCNDDTMLRLRSRGQRRRTFTRLERLAKETEGQIQELNLADYRKNWQLIQQLRLATQAAKVKNAPPEAKERLEELRKQDDVRIRALKSQERELLRELRKQFDRIERRTALFTVVLCPALLVLIASIVAWCRRR